MSTPSKPQQTSSTTARRRRIRALGVAGAVAAAVAVWVVSVVAGVDLQVTPGTDEPQTVDLTTVVTVSFAAALAAWGSLAALERVTGRGRRVWTILAVVVLAGSLLGPLAGVTAAATASLAAMHLAVGAVLIPVFARYSTAR